MNKNFQSQLKNVSKSLAALSEKVEKLSMQLEAANDGKKTAAAGKAAAPKSATSGGKTVLGTVYDHIKRSKKGVTVAQLKSKTQLDARQLSNALYKLSKKGVVHAKSRGLYEKK